MDTHRPGLTFALAFGLGAIATLALLWLMGHTGPVYAGPSARYVAPGGTDGSNACTTSGHPCATVQHAVDVAGDGDEVRVALGTYTGTHARPAPPGYSGSTIITQVVYISKTVPVRGGYRADFGAWDPAAYTTTLDAEGGGRVIFVGGEITPTLEGLRLTGGDADGLGGGSEGENAGGGVYVLTATATLSGCQVTNNTALAGGGVYLKGSADATLSSNTLRGNTAGNGGGVYLESSPNATLGGNTILSNTAVAAGGVALVSSPNATLSGNTILSNTASGDTGALGGGVALVLSDNATLSGNTIRGNTASVSSSRWHAYGGGVYLDQNADTTLSNNTILSNTADLGGGVILWHSSNATLSGNTIRGNTADSGGGVLLWDSDNAMLDNNAIADNQAGTAGSGIFAGASTAHLRHTTLARNGSAGLTTSGGGSGFYVTDLWGTSSSIALTNTILVSHTVGITVTAGNTATLNGVLWYGNGANTDGLGTLTVAHAITGDPAFAADGYHLTAGSEAIDAGVEAGVKTDVDHEPRPYQPPDLGADEYWPPGTLKRTYLPVVLRRFP